MSHTDTVDSADKDIKVFEDKFADRVSHPDSRIIELIEKDIKATEASKAAMTEVMTTKDFFSDVDDTHVIGIAGLLALNKILCSDIIDEFVIQWLIARKSRKGGRSRKDLVEMFKALREELQSKFSMMRDKFGGLFQ